MSPLRQRKLLRKGSALNWQYDYFITILTKDNIPLFGEIENGEMMLNAFGQIAYHFWERPELVYPYVKLFEFVIMPDHIHGIIRILPHAGETKSISMMMKSFKREVTKEIHLLDPGTMKQIWKPSFWVKGFKNERQLQAYRRYIINNPGKAWEKKKATERIGL